MSSILENEAIDYWNGSKESIGYSFFEDGFNIAVELIGECMSCEYLQTESCPIDSGLMKHISKNSFYCASYEAKH